MPVVRAGPFVFVAGFLAAHGSGDLGGIAPEAKVPDGHLWKGNRIELEVRYLIREKLIPALAGAGLGVGDAVKANVRNRNVTADRAVRLRRAGAESPLPLTAYNHFGSPSPSASASQGRVTLCRE